MKHLAYILCFYLTALTVLPSVRAIKMHFSAQCTTMCNSTTSENEIPSGCEKGKFIMNFNFSPVQFIQTLFIPNKVALLAFETSKKGIANYEKGCIDHYNNAIWQPPKIVAFSRL